MHPHLPSYSLDTFLQIDSPSERNRGLALTNPPKENVRASGFNKMTAVPRGWCETQEEMVSKEMSTVGTSEQTWLVKDKGNLA